MDMLLDGSVLFNIVILLAASFALLFLCGESRRRSHRNSKKKQLVNSKEHPHKLDEPPSTDTKHASQKYYVVENVGARTQIVRPPPFKAAESCFSASASNQMPIVRIENDSDKFVQKQEKEVKTVCAEKHVSIPPAASDPVIFVPANLRFTAIEGNQSLELVNKTKERVAIKTKCSDNKIYRVDPVFVFIEPCQRIQLTVHRLKAPAKVDKLVFLAVKAGKEIRHPQEAFKTDHSNAIIFVVPLFVTETLSNSKKKRGWCSK